MNDKIMNQKPSAKIMDMGMGSTVNSAILTDWSSSSYETWPVWGRISRDSFADAFKVASMLLENGYIKEVSLRKFISLIKEIEKEL